MALALLLRCLVAGELVMFAGAVMNVALSTLFLKLSDKFWEGLKKICGPKVEEGRQFSSVAQVCWTIFWFLYNLGPPTQRLLEPFPSHASHRLLLSSVCHDLDEFRPVLPLQDLVRSIDVYEQWANDQWTLEESICQRIVALRDDYVPLWMVSQLAGDDQADAANQTGKDIGSTGQQLEGELAACDYARNMTGPAGRAVIQHIADFARILEVEAAKRAAGQAQVQARGQGHVVETSLEALATMLSSKDIYNAQTRLTNATVGLNSLQEIYNAAPDSCGTANVRRIKTDWGMVAATESGSQKGKLRKLREAKSTWQCAKVG